MRSLMQLLLATLLSLAFASADQTWNSSVIALDEDTFEAFVLSTKHAFIACMSSTFRALCNPSLTWNST